MTNILLDQNAIFCALNEDRKGNEHFVYDGQSIIERAPNDHTGASLVFNVFHFISGYFGSNKRKAKY